MQLYVNLFASIAGAICGSLIGVAGGAAGDLAKKGRPIPAWVPRLFTLCMALGVLTIIVGFLAPLLQASGGVATIVGIIILYVTYRAKRTVVIR